MRPTQAICIVSVDPNNPDSHEDAIAKCESEAKHSLQRSKGHERLREGVWRFDVNRGMYPLAILVVYAKHHHLATEVLFLESETSPFVSTSSYEWDYHPTEPERPRDGNNRA